MALACLSCLWRARDRSGVLELIHLRLLRGLYVGACFAAQIYLTQSAPALCLPATYDRAISTTAYLLLRAAHLNLC